MKPPTDPLQPQPMKPYSALAACYDVVMAHVDYDDWAEHIHGLIMKYHPDAASILELGCGTGTLALVLQPMADYQYAGTDASEMMIRVAREKAALEGVPVQFEVSDFTQFRVEPAVDVVLLLYDGLNYLVEVDAVRSLLQCVHEALKPGGLFIFDQSTPANSLNNEAYFDDEGEAEGIHYVRRSWYDRDRRLHTNAFDILIEGQAYREVHVQRAYSLNEVREIIAQAPFELVAVFDQFTRQPASDESERLHWILRRT